MKELRLAVLGLSEGNGHPYSWSAIFNGYDPQAMAGCGFPVICEYLAEREFPRDAVDGARVTSVWTQDAVLSRQIADAALIETVLDRPEDAIGHVDGILLARDDPENHLEMARPFLQAGLPVYIDKPMATDLATAKAIFDLQHWPGQVFSCSALRYAQELFLDDGARNALGAIRHVHATVPKSWEKYAVHAIEPALIGLRPEGGVIRHQTWREGAIKTVNLLWADGKQATFSAIENGMAPIRISYVGETGSDVRTFSDSFTAFKSTLEAFVQSIRDKRQMIPQEFVLDVVRIIEYGTQS